MSPVNPVTRKIPVIIVIAYGDNPPGTTTPCTAGGKK